MTEPSPEVRNFVEEVEEACRLFRVAIEGLQSEPEPSVLISRADLARLLDLASYGARPHAIAQTTYRKVGLTEQMTEDLEFIQSIRRRHRNDSRRRRIQ